jgi:hypothetical protein
MSEDLNPLLNAYLDDRLSPAQRAKVLLRLKQPAVARRLERLRSLRVQLGAAAPEPSLETSRRMWSAIRAQLPSTAADLAPISVPEARSSVLSGAAESGGEAWYAFFTRPWVQGWSLGLSGAAAALALVFLLYTRSLTQPALVHAPVVSASAPVAVAASGPLAVATQGPLIRASGPQPAILAFKSAQPRTVLADARLVAKAPSTPVHSALPGAPAGGSSQAMALASLSTGATRPSSAGVTEVERALADNQVDGMIDQFLAVRQKAGPLVAGLEPASEAQPGFAQGGGADTVAYQQSEVPVGQYEGPTPVASGRALGGKDGNGFWDWNPAALALNQRDWPQARVELQAAAGKAGEATERAFADSALGLLSVPGGPLEGSQPLLPLNGAVRVLSAGTWQLMVDSRLARFVGGVSVHLPGLRADGDSFLLDLTFDRGEFSAGTHFIRVSGEVPARVIDANKQPVTADDFYAPTGADYDVADQELRLR